MLLVTTFRSTMALKVTAMALYPMLVKVLSETVIPDPLNRPPM